jgi:hypothetical protein
MERAMARKLEPRPERRMPRRELEDRLDEDEA